MSGFEQELVNGHRPVIGRVPSMQGSPMDRPLGGIGEGVNLGGV